MCAPWLAAGVRSMKASTRVVPIIMLRDFQSLGYKGEELDVRPGYARNYLIPQKISCYATPVNRAKFLKEKSEEEVTALSEQKRIAAVQKQMSKVKVTFKRHSTDGQTLYGSVTAKNIIDALAKQGIKILESSVKLSEPIKMLGDHEVPVTLETGDEFVLNIAVVKR